MKRRVNHFGYGCRADLVLATGCQAPVAPKGAAQKNPNDGDGAFATGRYRNLFVEAGHSPKEVRRKVDAAFQQLFHGDPTNQAVYFSVRQ